MKDKVCPRGLELLLCSLSGACGFSLGCVSVQSLLKRQVLEQCPQVGLSQEMGLLVRFFSSF